ncbi:hypothetical protein INR49_006690 [Caranx melampygus]|nr:hypothetical protein INR49_006690 [Caranx melampygus]
MWFVGKPGLDFGGHLGRGPERRAAEELAVDADGSELLRRGLHFSSSPGRYLTCPGLSSSHDPCVCPRDQRFHLRKSVSLNIGAFFSLPAAEASWICWSRAWTARRGEAVGTEEQTAVTIAGVPQAAFADHNVQYQFRTENSGGQAVIQNPFSNGGVLGGRPWAEKHGSLIFPPPPSAMEQPRPCRCRPPPTPPSLRQEVRNLLTTPTPHPHPPSSPGQFYVMMSPPEVLQTATPRTIAPRTHTYTAYREMTSSFKTSTLCPTYLPSPETLVRARCCSMAVQTVERRRRDKINNWIVTLSKIIPDCSVDSRTGASKGSILYKACDYIRELRQSNQQLQESCKEVERVKMDNELLRQQIVFDLRTRILSFISCGLGDRGAEERQRSAAGAAAAARGRSQRRCNAAMMVKSDMCNDTNTMSHPPTHLNNSSRKGINNDRLFLNLETRGTCTRLQKKTNGDRPTANLNASPPPPAAQRLRHLRTSVRCLETVGVCVAMGDLVQINQHAPPTCPNAPELCCRMSALPAKPGLRLSVSEWSSNNQQLSAAAQHERLVSRAIRQDGRSLRNETSCKTNWDESDTSRRLRDRVLDFPSKEQTEQALAATVLPLEVNTECVTLREGRRGPELVSDPVDEQLKKEVELIGRVQQGLQQHVDKAFEQLCVLQEARHQLTSDLQNKMDALDIDMSCLSLTIKSPQISLKTNPTRTPPGSSTPQEWLQFSQYNVARAQEAMALSQQMREDMSLTRAQLQNELETQRRATEFALRKRNHHEEQARDELQWQIKTTEDEMTEMENDIHGLDADLQAKTASLKLAHTRLEKRTGRPGMDLCRDEVQLGLVSEVHQLETTVTALKQKLAEAQLSLQKMKLHHGRMLQDLSRKQEALSLEQRSMKTRSHLTSASCSEKTPPPPPLVVPLMNSSGRSNLQLLAQ